MSTGLGNDRRGKPCQVGTLGMFIIDEFQFEDEVTGDNLGDQGMGSHIGGGGTYFAIGARMWLPPSEVLMTIDRGSDFTAKNQQRLDMYSQSREGEGQGSHSLWRYRDRQELTTRAVNIYRGQERGFAYLTPKLRLDPIDLLSDSFSFFPSFLHCICSPARAIDICDQIDQHRELWYTGKRPRIVWEPIPDSAVPENLEACLRVIGRIDVISPNHEEAASFLSIHKAKLGVENARTMIKELLLDNLFRRISLAKIENVPIVCIRSGALGALVALNEEEAVWVDAYHTSAEVGRVIDVTGAGNAFLGGFTAGLALTDTKGSRQSATPLSWTLLEAQRAAQMGSVSASFVVEQQSLPEFHVDAEGAERWNKEAASTRLRELEDRSN
ncbi:hypothetical protein CBS101457_001436 [Exobasidium rhododendri]|nr:hypothetical protein CBS101457_001436 [Exobasidium rhododendri]